MISSNTAARLHLAVVYMAQENAFGIKIDFPAGVRPLADKPMDELTEAEAEELIAAGMAAHQQALFGAYPDYGD